MTFTSKNLVLKDFIERKKLLPKTLETSGWVCIATIKKYTYTASAPLQQIFQIRIFNNLQFMKTDSAKHIQENLKDGNLFETTYL